jgi:hypothetical protein
MTINRYDNDPYNSVWIASKDGKMISDDEINKKKVFKYLTMT